MSHEAWRPPTLRHYVGQRGLITLLADELDAAKANHRPLPHMLFTGPPGVGKTTIVSLMAQEMGSQPPIELLGRNLKKDIDLATAFASLDATGYDAGVKSPTQGSIVDRKQIRPGFILVDECEEMAADLFEALHGTLEPGPDGRRWFSVCMPRFKNTPEGPMKKIWVPEFTLVFITNHLGMLRKKAGACINRMEINWHFDFYTVDELSKIIQQYAQQIQVPIDEDACLALAQRAHGTARNALNLFKRAKSRMEAQRARGEHCDKIDLQVVQDAMDTIRVDDRGFTKISREYMQAIATSPTGKLSASSLASTLGVDEKTITQDIEPPLIKARVVAVVSGGRALTDEGMSLMNGRCTDPVLMRLVQD